LVGGPCGYLIVVLFGQNEQVSPVQQVYRRPPLYNNHFVPHYKYSNRQTAKYSSDDNVRLLVVASFIDARNDSSADAETCFGLFGTVFGGWLKLYRSKDGCLGKKKKEECFSWKKKNKIDNMLKR
jgi:hypothetical protein